jgi:tripartite-type tricarboxylate transporter receptor subunit TctC
VSVNNDPPVKDIASLMSHARPTRASSTSRSAPPARRAPVDRAAQGAGGIELTIVPYKGTAPAFQDRGGQIQGFVDRCSAR